MSRCRMKDWLNNSRIGKALVMAGALLLLLCYVTDRESNAELLAGLILIILGLIYDVWQLKRGAKY